jgi:uncharacterized repeat protein (TIGR03803 family)
MQNTSLGRHAATLCFTAALLAGCGGSQPPIGAPGAIPWNSASARVGTARQRIPPGLHFQVLHRFHFTSGVSPRGRLRNVRGTLYGTTHQGGLSRDGTVYSISNAGAYKVLHQFGGNSDGARPLGGLIDVSGTLYGTTSEGGSSGCFEHKGCGTVYSINTAGSENMLHSFTGGSDGISPSEDLLDVNGTLYGTTLFGGGSGCQYGDGCGTVYRLSTAGIEKILYRFAGGSDGVEPMGLTYANGRLYGTTFGGGGLGCASRGGCGIVYSLSTTGSEKVLHRFGRHFDGQNPHGELVAINGTLYGTTLRGGSYFNGIVFAISATGNERILHNFGASGPDGLGPSAGLLDVQGRLYGTTGRGGSLGGGAVYTISTTGAEKVIYSFDGDKSNGNTPNTALIEINGALYGTMLRGGASQCGAGCGTIYALSP